jgi:rhodanese-related sulfurtransferase
VSSYPRVQHAEMAAALADDAALPMLDLRRVSEWADGHVEGAKHVPLHELRERMDEVLAWASSTPAAVWVYCGSGFRASIGCSILEAAGVSVVHVDDDFPNAAKAGLPVTVAVEHETLGEAYAD